jgi:tRNA A-37 threonylcarbamoyl transferase component Bud32/predicted nucleotidyltransferase
LVDVVEQGVREALLRLAREKSGGHHLVGCCIYGSQVAGYARPDSDYDLLVVLKDFRPRVRYVYAEGPPKASLLLVDSVALVRDAENAALGEFVAGRLLNPYLPLVGGEFIEGVERALKRRVVIEALRDLLGEVGPIATELLIPPEYFLFEKLRMRMAIYPPATYSYVKTYAGPEGGRNIHSSLEGFRRVLEALRGEGVLERLDGHYRLLRDVGANLVLARALRDAYRGVRHYAVHGYAGRVGWRVVAWEAASKLSRVREVQEIPAFLSQPRSLLRLPEGRPIFSDHWEQEVLDALGLENPRVVERRRAGPFSTREFWSVVGREGGARLTVKRYGDISSLKWALLGLWALPGKRYVVSPAIRMAREYYAIRALRGLGVRTPRVLALAIPSHVMVTEMVDGTSLEGHVVRFLLHGEKRDVVAGFGELMGRVHGAGWTLGDAKPENVLVDGEGRYVLVDLEQAEEGGDPCWDIAVFFYYSLRFIEKTDAVRRLTQVFAESYSRHSSPEHIRGAARARYLTPFQPIVTREVFHAFREAAEEAVARRG